MINISNDIKIGVEYYGLCDYWSDVKTYTHHLDKFILDSKKFEENFNGTLKCFFVFSKNNILYEIYYFSINNTQYELKLEIDINTKKLISNIISTNNDIDKLLNQSKYILDLDHFLKNN